MSLGLSWRSAEVRLPRTAGLLFLLQLWAVRGDLLNPRLLGKMRQIEARESCPLVHSAYSKGKFQALLTDLRAMAAKLPGWLLAAPEDANPKAGPSEFTAGSRACLWSSTGTSSAALTADVEPRRRPVLSSEHKTQLQRLQDQVTGVLVKMLNEMASSQAKGSSDERMVTSSSAKNLAGSPPKASPGSPAHRAKDPVAPPPAAAAAAVASGNLGPGGQPLGTAAKGSAVSAWSAMGIDPAEISYADQLASLELMAGVAWAQYQLCRCPVCAVRQEVALRSLAEHTADVALSEVHRAMGAAAAAASAQAPVAGDYSPGEVAEPVAAAPGPAEAAVSARRVLQMYVSLAKDRLFGSDGMCLMSSDQGLRAFEDLLRLHQLMGRLADAERSQGPGALPALAGILKDIEGAAGSDRPQDMVRVFGGVGLVVIKDRPNGWHFADPRPELVRRAKAIVERMSGRPLSQQLGAEAERCLSQLASGLKAALANLDRERQLDTQLDMASREVDSASSMLSLEWESGGAQGKKSRDMGPNTDVLAAVSRGLLTSANFSSLVFEAAQFPRLESRAAEQRAAVAAMQQLFELQQTLGAAVREHRESFTAYRNEARRVITEAQEARRGLPADFSSTGSSALPELEGASPLVGELQARFQKAQAALESLMAAPKADLLSLGELRRTLREYPLAPAALSLLYQLTLVSGHKAPVGSTVLRGVLSRAEQAASDLARAQEHGRERDQVLRLKAALQKRLEAEKVVEQLSRAVASSRLPGDAARLEEAIRAVYKAQVSEGLLGNVLQRATELRVKLQQAATLKSSLDGAMVALRQGRGDLSAVEKALEGIGRFVEGQRSAGVPEDSLLLGGELSLARSELERLRSTLSVEEKLARVLREAGEADAIAKAINEATAAGVPAGRVAEAKRIHKTAKELDAVVDTELVDSSRLSAAMAARVRAKVQQAEQASVPQPILGSAVMRLRQALRRSIRTASKMAKSILDGVDSHDSDRTNQIRINSARTHLDSVDALLAELAALG